MHTESLYTAASPRRALPSGTRSAAMAITASLTLAAACGGKAPPAAKPDAPDPGAAAKPAEPAPPPPSAPVAALPGAGERAFIADETGLVEVSTAGGSQVVAPGAKWCSADARANAVWFTTDQGLHAFDLADRRTRLIAKGDFENLEIIAAWGPQQLGGENKVGFAVGAALQLDGSKPAFAVAMGCDGDAAHQCFEEDLQTPLPEIAAQQKRVAALVVSDPAYVSQLAARGKQGSLWTPPPVPPAMPKKKPTVNKKRCEEDAATCGSLTAIPASPLWLVQTANSRGDFYHETRDLWDPATGEFLRRDGAKLVRTKTAPPTNIDAETSYAGMRVSPAGALSLSGAVFDASKVHFVPKGAEGLSSSCGWANGGWRITGPTDD